MSSAILESAMAKHAAQPPAVLVEAQRAQEVAVVAT